MVRRLRPEEKAEWRHQQELVRARIEEMREEERMVSGWELSSEHVNEDLTMMHNRTSAAILCSIGTICLISWILWYHEIEVLTMVKAAW